MPHAEHVPTIRELEALSANENDGKAGFRLVDSRDHINGVTTYRDNNLLTGEISNLGREDHTFTLEVSYAGGKTFTVKGIPLDDAASASPKRTVSIPVNLPADFRGSCLPLKPKRCSARCSPTQRHSRSRKPSPAACSRRRARVKIWRTGTTVAIPAGVLARSRARDARTRSPRRP